MAAPQAARTLRPFGLRDQFGYLAGNFAGDFTYTLCTGFMMKFYTDVLGVSAAIVGIAMTVAQILDAVTDLGMGQICDRSPTTEQGKFRPWIRRIAGPVSLISFLMYASWIKEAPMTLKIVWLFVTYLLYSSVFYTMIIIPYGSMASAMSNDALDRTKLSNWRHVGGTLAVTVINFIVPLVVYVDVTQPDGSVIAEFNGTSMMLCALVFSILSFVLWMACYFMTTERVKIPSKNEKLNLGAFVSDLFHNRGLIAIVLMIIVQECSNSAFHRMSGYMFDNVFQSGALQSITSPVETIITLLIAACIVKIVAKVGKKEITVTGCLISAAVFAVAFLLHTTSVYVWLVIYGGVTVGLALFNPVTFALVTDIVDDEEVRTGNRMDGTIYSVYSFGRKFGSALSSGVTGVMLSIIGYDSYIAAGDKYAPALTNGIYNISCIVPMIGFGLMALMSGFHAKAQKAIKELLERRPEFEGRVIGYAQNPQAKLEWNMEAAPDIYKPDSKMADVHKWIFDKFGSIDVVVNAKGGHVPCTMAETDKKVWAHSMEVVESAFVNVKLALPYLEKSKAPRVINMTSCDGRHGGWRCDPAFAAARGGLEAMTYEMAKELGPMGITCNIVLIGHIEQDVPPETILTDEARARLLAATPLGRLGQPQDVVAAVEFLASEEAGFVNGARIDVNGGFVVG